MKNPQTTVMILLAIGILLMWKSGKLSNLFNIAFGKSTANE
jgi:hypothetical protein